MTWVNVLQPVIEKQMATNIRTHRNFISFSSQHDLPTVIFNLCAMVSMISSTSGIHDK